MPMHFLGSFFTTFHPRSMGGVGRPPRPPPLRRYEHHASLVAGQGTLEILKNDAKILNFSRLRSLLAPVISYKLDNFHPKSIYFRKKY